MSFLSANLLAVVDATTTEDGNKKAESLGNKDLQFGSEIGS